MATFTGGTAAISNGSYEIIIGDAAAATGVLNVGTEAGGNALITTGSSPLGIQVTDNLETSGSATLNLNPGTVNIQGGAITKGGAAGSTATVNLNGVTLQAGLLGFLLIDNSLNSVDVYNGGLIVDTQGNNTAITANLSATTGNGIYANNGNGALAVSTNGGILTLSGVNMYSGPTNVSGGSLVLAAAGSLPTGTNLSIAAGASVVANNLGTPIALSVGSLSVAGTLDLNNNSLVVHSSTLAAVTSLVKSGYNNGGWNGNVGIISSAAANDGTELTALGVIANDNGSGYPLYGSGGTISRTFDGASPVDGDVLVKYTYYGDTDLNGYVDGTDYSRIDNAFLANQTNPGEYTGWYNGDVNYDGVIDGSDYTLMDNAFNRQGAQLSAQIATSTAQIAGSPGMSSVPEPASLGVLAICVIGLLGRRNQRHR